MVADTGIRIPSRLITDNRIDAIAVSLYAFLVMEADDSGLVTGKPETIARTLQTKRGAITAAFITLVRSGWVDQVQRKAMGTVYRVKAGSS